MSESGSLVEESHHMPFRLRRKAGRNGRTCTPKALDWTSCLVLTQQAREASKTASNCRARFETAPQDVAAYGRKWADSKQWVCNQSHVATGNSSIRTSEQQESVIGCDTRQILFRKTTNIIADSESRVKSPTGLQSREKPYPRMVMESPQPSPTSSICIDPLIQANEQKFWEPKVMADSFSPHKFAGKSETVKKAEGRVPRVSSSKATRHGGKRGGRKDAVAKPKYEIPVSECGPSPRDSTSMAKFPMAMLAS